MVTNPDTKQNMLVVVGSSAVTDPRTGRRYLHRQLRTRNLAQNPVHIHPTWILSRQLGISSWRTMFHIKPHPGHPSLKVSHMRTRHLLGESPTTESCAPKCGTRITGLLELRFQAESLHSLPLPMETTTVAAIICRNPCHSQDCPAIPFIHSIYQPTIQLERQDHQPGQASVIMKRAHLYPRMASKQSVREPTRNSSLS